MSEQSSEKLQKLLARAGLGSRREMEGWIEAGRVSVNRKRATLGDRVQPSDVISVDGRPLPSVAVSHPPVRVLRYNKSAGQVCTRSDPQGRPTVFDRLPGLRQGRWIAVGRLDFNTSGLLLFTNDGELAHRLMHPSSELVREYAVRVKGQVAPAVIERLRKGVELEDGQARFESISDAGGEGVNHWYHVTLNEGRNREVRRLWESQGLQVSRLTRVRFGPLELRRGLRPGNWEELTPADMAILMRAVGMDYTPSPKKRSPVRRKRAPRTKTRAGRV